MRSHSIVPGASVRLAASVALVALLATACAANRSTPAAEPEPAGAVEARAVALRLNEALLDIAARSDELGQQGREDTIRAVVLEVFDVPQMARSTLGRHFDGLDAAQQARWVEVFTEFHVSATAWSWRRDRGSRFEYLGVVPAPRGTLLVRSTLDRAAQGAVVRRDYRMARIAGQWRIIDVYTPGSVSSVGMMRSEYLALLARGSFEDLVAEMQRRIERRRAD